MKRSRKAVIFFLILFSFVAAGYIAAFITEILATIPFFFFLKKSYCLILLTLLITLCMAPITQPLVVYLRAYHVRVAQHAPLAKRTTRIVCSFVIVALIIPTGGWLIHSCRHVTSIPFFVLMIGYAVSLFHIAFLLIWNIGESNE